MSNHLRAAASVAALLLGACLFREEESTPALPIVPLAVGNTWIYLDSAYYGTDSIATDSSLLAITGKRAVYYGGRTDTVYLLNASRRPSAAPRDVYEYVRNHADGLHTRGYREDTAEYLDDIIHLRHPAMDGERYLTRFQGFRVENGIRVPAQDTIEIEVADADRTCKVPAGTFRCIQYRGWRPGNVLHATAYYAPGVGFIGSEVVRTETVNGTPRTVTTVRRLAAFTLY